MDYSEYRLSLSNRLAVIMDENGVTEADAFLQYACDTFTEFGITEGISAINMEDTKAGNKVVRIDAYSFDDTDHSLNLYICDYDNDPVPAKLTTALIDKSYWRLYYYLICNDLCQEAKCLKQRSPRY